MTREEIIEIARLDRKMAYDILTMHGVDEFDGTIGQYEQLERLLKRDIDKETIIEIQMWNADEDKYEWRAFNDKEYEELTGRKLKLEKKEQMRYEVWSDIERNPKLVAKFLRRWQAEKFAETEKRYSVLIRPEE